MSRILSATGALVDQIKINAVTREERAGRTLWIKRRRWASRPIMACANRFFRLAGNPVQAINDLPAWQRWEVDWFLRLHGDRFQAFAEGTDSVAAEEVPGESLSFHLNRGTLAPEMLGAAARELRRAHSEESEFFRGPWSHGDPHSGNFIFERDTGRARLIDFEVTHRPDLAPQERHADDLLVLLQDLSGRIQAEDWLPCAQAFLRSYDRPEIIALLREKLVIPGGLGRIWWAVRTTYLAPAELQRRIGALRDNI
jgi:hypothetical protein